jgi:hypothetical protein
MILAKGMIRGTCRSEATIADFARVPVVATLIKMLAIRG